MKTESQISEWIKKYLAEILELDPYEINEKQEFEQFGLNSSMAVFLIGDLEEWLSLELSPSLFFEFKTIGELSIHIAEMVKKEKALEQEVSESV
ncbi:MULTISPECIES: acyl carrier protein [unclassified Moorena]|uniref:acyl carrier protein n=1 Tax=unclassified Moorena TaxID=2683338 RepID=UPI0013B893E4|nr:MULTISPECIES: acyl carrier protein [unclassified Moorena]NER86416.1 acyl carrier protein [Moorena sp. SIO3A2]NET66241.1 acyl carrier protein [Moorena sp. SIO1G6]